MNIFLLLLFTFITQSQTSNPEKKMYVYFNCGDNIEVVSDFYYFFNKLKPFMEKEGVTVIEDTLSTQCGYAFGYGDKYLFYGSGTDADIWLASMEFFPKDKVDKDVIRFIEQPKNLKIINIQNQMVEIYPYIDTISKGTFELFVKSASELTNKKGEYAFYYRLLLVIRGTKEYLYLERIALTSLEELGHEVTKTVYIDPEILLPKGKIIGPLKIEINEWIDTKTARVTINGTNYHLKADTFIPME